jgi:hypothetical protein
VCWFKSKTSGGRLASADQLIQSLNGHIVRLTNQD